MISITIDGPAGAGKSTVADCIAKKLRFLHVDTGALYRAIAFYIISKNINLKESSINNILKSIDLKLSFINNKQFVFLNNENITEKIRTEEVSKLASDISAFQEVREFLLDFQRKFAESNNIIMDGRDIGTVVLPNADVKIFLTASIEERVKRRLLEINDNTVSYETVFEEMKSRDENDSNREIAPLKPANDAIIFDSTYLNFQETVDKLSGIIENKLKGGSFEKELSL